MNKKKLRFKVKVNDDLMDYLKIEDKLYHIIEYLYQLRGINSISTEFYITKNKVLGVFHFENKIIIKNICKN